MNTDSIKSITGDITPLPWKSSKNNIKGVDESNVAITFISNNSSTPFADASYIVKACNEYPTLKIENEKLQALNSELIEALEEMTNIVGKLENDEIFDSWEKAKELINKAKAV